MNLVNKTSNKSMNYIASISIIGSILIQAVNFLLIPVLTRELGPSGYGIISIYTTWVAIINAVVSLQTTQAIIHINLEIDEIEQKHYLANMIMTSVVAYLILLFFVLIFNKPISNILGFEFNILIVLVLHSLGSYCVNFIIAISIQYQKPILQFSISLIISISTAVLSIILIRNIDNIDFKYLGRIIGYAIPNIIVGLVALIYLVSNSRKFIKMSYLKQYLPLCIPLIFHSLSAIIFSQSDRIILQYFFGNSVAGIYSFLYSMASILSIVWTSINSFFLPFFLKYMRKNNLLAIHVKTKNYLYLFTSLYIGFLLIIPELSKIMGGSELFLSDINCIPIIALGIYFNFLYSFNSNYEIYYKKTKIIAIGTIFSAIVNIILNFTMIPLYGIYGAAIASLISYISLLIFHYLNAKNIAKNKNVAYIYSVKTFLPWILIAILITIVFYYIKDLIVLRYILAILTGGTLLYKIRKNKTII